MGRVNNVKAEYFFVNNLVPVLNLLKTIRFSEKTNPLIFRLIDNKPIDCNLLTDQELLECFKSNRYLLQNSFLALTSKKTWLAKHSEHYRGMSDTDFINHKHKLKLLRLQSKAVFSLLDSLILSIETIHKYYDFNDGLFQERQCVELFNVGFLPLLRIFGLPLTTFDHKSYVQSDNTLSCHQEYHYVNQTQILKLISDFFKLNEDLTSNNIFDHEGLFSKIPRLYSYWGRALLFSTHHNEPTRSSYKVFENKNYMQLLYKNSQPELMQNLQKHNFLIPQLKNTISAIDVSNIFNLNCALEFLNTSFCCKKPFSERYVLNQKDLTTKRNFIFAIGYGLLLETAHIESKASHIERNPLDAYLATDTLVGFYCHFGIEPIDSGNNTKRNVIGYGKPSQIKSELIHLFLNHLYVYLPKRLDTYLLDVNVRNNLLADKTEKSTLAHESYFQKNFAHQLEVLPNVSYLYKSFKPEFFDLPLEIEVDDRLTKFINVI